MKIDMKYSALLITLLLLFVSNVAAESSSVERAEKISSEIMSPYCPGRTLASCPSDNARELRAEIAKWFDQGYSETAVHNQLQMLYGVEVFGVPEKRGVGLLGWYAPAIFVIAGLALVYLFLKRGMKFLARSGKQKTKSIAPEKKEQIEQELEKRMREGR